MVASHIYQRNDYGQNPARILRARRSGAAASRHAAGVGSAGHDKAIIMPFIAGFLVGVMIGCIIMHAVECFSKKP